MKTPKPDDILTFWFNDLRPEQWFTKDVQLDALIRKRFSGIHQAARHLELFSWRNTAYGRLAEIIVLDQFSRNIYRNQPQAFAQDDVALALAQEAVTHSADLQLSPAERGFLYMPYMHSESAVIHEQAVILFNQLGLESNYEFELKHKAIIDRFGRYPHRNAILGRLSTEKELAFLQTEGSSF